MTDLSEPEPAAGGVTWDRQALAGVEFYGLGPSTDSSLGLRGKAVRAEIPLLISTAEYGEYHAIPGSYRFDFTAADRYRIVAPGIDYFFYYGPTPKEIFEEHNAVRPAAEPLAGRQGASGAAAPRPRSMERSDESNAEKRINHPQDVLKVGQVVRAQVLEVDTGRRRLRLGMKQLIPTSVDEYIAEHKDGDVVTGRMTEVGRGQARVELGEGIQAVCRLTAETLEKEEKPADPKTDISSLTSMLEAKWKGGQATGAPRREPVRAGQIRSFRIIKLDVAGKRIELELA